MIDGVHEVRVRVPAKINLALRVGRLRPDGFHPLDTVFEAVDLYDDIIVRPASRLTLTITGRGTDLPTDGSNLALRAAHVLQKTGYQGGADIAIRKRIPVAGGMAGGSADAAGVLLALNALWDLGLSGDQLHEMASQLGSDVPFALRGGLAHGCGRGERLQPFTSPRTHEWIVVVSREGLSTPAVFREFDTRSAPITPGDTRAVRAAIAHGEPIADLLANDLQDPAVRVRPDLAELIQSLRAYGMPLLSGSGPTIVVLASEHPAGREPATAAAHIAEQFGVEALVARGPVSVCGPKTVDAGV